MNAKSVYWFALALALALIFTGLGAVAVRGEPNQAGSMRDLDAIESDESALERGYVAGLLSAYIDGFAAVGADHPSVQRWRSRLALKTDPVALARGIDPLVVHDSFSRITDSPDAVVVDLLLDVWQRLDEEAKSARVPAEPVYLNVPPPEGALVRSGVDPSAIDDPELRAQYERAIRENRYRAAELRTTLALRHAYSEYIAKASLVLRDAALRMSQEDRAQLTARIRDSGWQGAEALLDSLQSP